MRTPPPTPVSPPADRAILRPLALRREDAARVIGVSEELFDKHVRPSLPVVRLGTVRVYPVAELERWLLERADSPAAELERAR